MAEPRTPEPEVGGRDLLPPCCVPEQDTCTPRTVLVIPRKWWFLPDMTEKLLTGTLRKKSRKSRPLYQLIQNPWLFTQVTAI